jgi:hypothetical protein
MKFTGGSASSDAVVSEQFPGILEVMVKKVPLQQSRFIIDETGLFAKRMPARTNITRKSERYPDPRLQRFK